VKQTIDFGVRTRAANAKYGRSPRIGVSSLCDALHAIARCPAWCNRANEARCDGGGHRDTDGRSGTEARQ